MGCVSAKKTVKTNEIRPANHEEKKSNQPSPPKPIVEPTSISSQNLEISKPKEIVGKISEPKKNNEEKRPSLKKIEENKKPEESGDHNSEPKRYEKKSSKLSEKQKKVIGNYQLEEKIIEIPYGAIYKCVHMSSGLKRTMKILDIRSSEVVSLNPKHLEAELNSLKSLDHPNILKIHDMFHTKKKFYIVMEPWEGSLLIEGLTSLQHINENKVANIISQILSAVAYCHSKQVIHRDLNPKIIFLSNPEDPKLKIAEFGASSFVDPENTFAGKRHSKKYTAPEVFENYYNEKCDLWSVGCIMHLLLVGELPFYNKNHPEQAISEVNYESLYEKGLSQNAVDLLQKLLEKDFAKRISALEALEHTWIKGMLNSQNNSKVIASALDGLKHHKKHSEIQDAIREFVAGQIISFDESIEIATAFKAIDTNWDGKISKEELLNHYLTTMNDDEAKATVEAIFHSADSDRSGFIEYNEFVKAAMKKRYLLSIENIEKAFKLLDEDNSSKLSKTELQSLLGESADKNLMKLIAEADLNGDGEIDFKEFYTLLRKKYDI